MARILFLCGLLSTGLVCQGQLNYEGNPLTEDITYTAQESQSSRLNARQRIEAADARTRNLSNRPFIPSAIDPLTRKENESSLPSDDVVDVTKYEEIRETTTRESLVTDKGSPLMMTNHSADTQATSTAPSELIEPPIEPVKLSITIPREESRQLRQYPMRSVFSGVHQAGPYFQQVSQSYHQTSRSRETPEESPIPVNNPVVQPRQSSISQNSNEALSEFLNSRTPEESEFALHRFMTERERASHQSAQHALRAKIGQPGKPSEPREAVRSTFDNEISPNYENSHHRSMDHVRTLPTAGLPDVTNQVSYLTREEYRNLYSSPRWSQNGAQPRRDNFYPGAPGRRHPGYRGPIRARVVPWAQPRIAPGAPIYLQKAPLYPGPPTPAGNHPWKQPVEVIYTKPPDSSISNHPIPSSNQPAVYEDASKWFPESAHQPPQKDIYYSQLYAQSYDPHYYNYIAKTGKIKPWLYGKLGKSEEKSIWWELYTGFKNHGMKNMMNPMFLLGMSIPTLTLMLSALIQKRSAARAYAGLYDPQEFLDVYEPQIRAAILAYENQANGSSSSKERTEGARRRKRSTEQSVSPGFPSEESSEKLDAQQHQEKNTGVGKEESERAPIGQAPPGVYPFEEYFLAHQAEFAQAFLAYEKEQKEKYEKEQKEDNNEQRSIGPAPPGVYPFEEYFLAHQAEFAQAFLAYEKEQQKKDAERQKKDDDMVQEKGRKRKGKQSYLIPPPPHPVHLTPFQHLLVTLYLSEPPYGGTREERLEYFNSQIGEIGQAITDYENRNRAKEINTGKESRKNEENT
ncbi:uncharacterized protein [Venturia canescens]|uniref:uncharacterized protein n=1 Tax=Venturia canescens TaxID=32260 RepID=UPI001C9C209F|nr:uncharacterized protein LOC122413389 [Venturia canescens]